RPADIRRLQQELTLMLGFDPTTLQGLKDAGLATDGPVAAELVGSGSGAVWAIPVEEPKKLLPIIDTIMKARGGADEASTETKEGVKITTFFVEFGPKKVIRAAHAVARGHLVWGFGPRSAELVLRAVRLAKKDSVRVVPAYKKIVAQLGEAFDVRMTSPRGGQAIRSAVRRFARGYADVIEPVLARTTSAGWVGRYNNGAVQVDGWVGLDEQGQAMSKRIFVARGVAPVGVTAVDLETAVAFVQAGGDPQALLEAVAPVGSDLRKRLEARLARFKNELGIDLLGTLLPKFSGHVAASMGTGDLSNVPFGALVGNPLAQTWTTFAASTTDMAAMNAAESKLGDQLKARNVRMKARQVDDAEVRDLVPLSDENADPLFSTFTYGGAWGFSVEPVMAEMLIKNRKGRDRLQGQPGVFAELRIDRFVTELRRFQIRELPIIYRAVATKIVDYISLFRQLNVRVAPVAEGLRMQGELQFSAGYKSP
ncbi:MAG: hypothetical protein AAF449_02610, partial [Myxococcota bacterium]